MTVSFILCLVVAHFVSPLLFFTNLTRNPYITQICLLNAALAAAGGAYLVRGAWAPGGIRVPRSPLDGPWLATLAACAASWAVAYVGHAAFFRPAMVSEGSRSALFLVCNAMLPYYLSAALPWDDGGRPDRKGVALGWWSAFVVLWGFLWVGFPQMRGPSSPSADPWLHVWDPYGALVWASGLAAAFWLCRRGRVLDFLHLALAAGALASLYGISQYFNFEFIWPNVLNPYGGRSVSTFGNPNFLSSYNVLLLPVAVACFIEARSSLGRLVYGAVALALQAALFCTMTRSSWAGALAAVLLLLALSTDLRRTAALAPRPCGLLAATALAVVLFWPASSIATGYTPSVISRLTEMSQAAKSSVPYSPLYQRVLIWGGAWLMGAENPLTGKGWGLFELFYPFYQGHLLNTFDVLAGMRTHANNAHNEILEVWSQTGLFGLGAWAWLWTTFFAVARRWSRQGRRPGVWTAAVAGVAGMLVDNMLNVSLHFAVPGFLCWWMAGLAMGAAGAEPEGGRWRTIPRPAVAKALAAAAVAAALAASWYWVRVWEREVHYFAGFKLIRQGTMPMAIRELETSRSWGPREVNAIYELGNAYARSDRFSDADSVYAEALRANAGYDEIYFNIATIKISRLKQTERALDYYRMAWSINPLSADVYNGFSAALLQDLPRHRAEALQLLQRATHFFPANPQHWHNLGYLFALEKRWPEAMDAYSRALALTPDMKSSEQALLAAAARAGRPPPEIVEGIARMRELDARLSRGDYSQASLDEALRLAARFPEMSKARFLAGSLLLYHQKAEQARPHLEWVVSHDPKNVAALANLGQADLAAGRIGEAAARFRQALSLDPANAGALAGLRSLGLK
ncbi:MAG: O-antigen ligase family protein [Elusimicrobia bacterium]|nr:O-antigen ligase family protein [Elusimicrobiota bacterium]